MKRAKDGYVYPVANVEPVQRALLLRQLGIAEIDA